ncbi:MAG: hypothetical protein AAGA30_15860, partial [Planctomycetota bacterium]
MLNVVCPICQQAMKLGQPKEGKFTPRCKHCKEKFQLLIKQLPDKSFKYKTAKISATTKPFNAGEKADTGDETRVDPEAVKATPPKERTSSAKATSVGDAT